MAREPPFPACVPAPKMAEGEGQRARSGRGGVRGQRQVREQTCGSRLERALVFPATRRPLYQRPRGKQAAHAGRAESVQHTDKCISDYKEKLGMRMLLNEEYRNVSCTPHHFLVLHILANFFNKHF